MILTAILNATLAVGVIVMVITPLVWAILTEHRDHRRRAATDGATGTAAKSRARKQTRRPYQPVAGQA